MGGEGALPHSQRPSNFFAKPGTSPSQKCSMGFWKTKICQSIFEFSEHKATVSKKNLELPQRPLNASKGLDPAYHRSFPKVFERPKSVKAFWSTKKKWVSWLEAYKHTVRQALSLTTAPWLCHQGSIAGCLLWFSVTLIPMYLYCLSFNQIALMIMFVWSFGGPKQCSVLTNPTNWWAFLFQQIIEIPKESDGNWISNLLQLKPTEPQGGGGGVRRVNRN